MDFFDSPAGFDDPVAMWMRCHRRIERQLEMLAQLPAHIAARDVDAQASSAAQAILNCFETTAMQHHDDEEHDLFPLLEKRITDSADLALFRELRTRLDTDHNLMESCWAKIRKALQGIADGIIKPLDRDEVENFRRIYENHIPAEDVTIPRLANCYLSAADLERLGRSMAARRSVPYPA